MKRVWNKIIHLINAKNNLNDYRNKYLKIKINSDYDLLLNLSKILSI